MNNLNPSRKPAARTRSGNLLALLLPAVLILALLMLFLAGGATASAQVVTNRADSGPGTLRSAITNAANGAVITFDPSLSGATITLTINTNLTIDALALPGGLQINGHSSVQDFNVASNTLVFLNSLTIIGGFGVYGGGIFNDGTLTLTNCILSGNSATNSGGGIYNYGTLTLNQCTLSGNSAANGGGGIFILYGTLALNQCTLSGNSAATSSGGGIFSSHGLLTLNQCTLSGNSAKYGGGIDDFEGALAMTNTIVAGNSGTDIINGGVVTYGGSNLVQSDPDLAPLGNYGGPTQTMPPLPGSPAIGAGSMAANIFATDQRGYPRTQNGLIDIGAVELQSPAANPPVLKNLTVPAGGGNGLQFTFTNAPAADFTVLTATNVSLALTNWTVLGEVQQIAPGQYQFTDPQAATNLVRFYRVRSP
jgi:predicted outer membrane repeat protein